MAVAILFSKSAKAMAVEYLSGTLFQMMSGVPHHSHHLSLV